MQISEEAQTALYKAREQASEDFLSMFGGGKSNSASARGGQKRKLTAEEVKKLREKQERDKLEA